METRQGRHVLTPADVYRQALPLLTEVYPLAKESILFYETHERVKAISALTDLRDALDHLAIAAIIAQKKDSRLNSAVRDNLVSVGEHLRRAAVEPLELAVEDRMYSILHKVKYGEFGPLTRWGRQAPESVMADLRKATDSLETARAHKGGGGDFSACISLLRETYGLLESVDDALPSWELSQKRRTLILSTLGVAALGAIGGLALTLLVQQLLLS